MDRDGVRQRSQNGGISRHHGVTIGAGGTERLGQGAGDIGQAARLHQREDFRRDRENADQS